MQPNENSLAEHALAEQFGPDLETGMEAIAAFADYDNGAGVHYLVSSDARELATFTRHADGKNNTALEARDNEERAFIVRAVNSHADLVAALEALMPMDDNDGSTLLEAYRAEFAQARAALAKAKGVQS